MVTIKMLKPYYIKTDRKYVRVILAYQYFSLNINEKIYHFVPTKANEIQINRETKKVVNTDAIFAFQSGKDIVNIPMTDLISLPDFLIQLYFIIESYYSKNKIEEKQETFESAAIIKELEHMNLKRLIDQALDARDEKAFFKLVKLL